MTHVLDSSGWLEYFVNGANARIFAAPAQDIENLIVPAICVYEVFKRVLIAFGEDDALDTIGQMSLGKVVDMDRNTAIHAARLSVELKLAMADSMILATAQLHNATLWTQDEHFKDLDGVKYVQKK
ncbi:MAG: type II toxin-antitoxin system VapC family toxin [Anaerolineales bacterium]|nr:MAG: type II toxin-antitoxin system VapC family toxin [Anaerolineales bacterium]